jgi:hypothetical protein
VPRQSYAKWKERCNQVTEAKSRDNLLKLLLALDRIVVERAMHFYKIPASERRVVRHQNRRVHAAIREINAPLQFGGRHGISFLHSRHDRNLSVSVRW